MALQHDFASATNIEDLKLGQFFLAQLKDIYWAEQRLVKTIPKMAEVVGTQQLKQALNDHLDQTKQHVTRLEQVFDLLGEEKKAEKCKAMAGITEEGEDIIDITDKETATRDAAVIFAAQKVEHYEIATYGGLVELARCLDHNDIAEILENTLREEKDADVLLTQIATTNINSKACTEPA